MKVLTNYLRYWYLFLIGAAVCIVLAFLYIRYKVVPEYGIAVKILLNDKQDSGATGAEAFGNLGLLKVSRNITDEIGVLQSYDLMRSAVKEMGMAVGYYVEGRVGDVEVYEKSLPIKAVLNDSLSIIQYGTVGSVVMVDTNYYKLNMYGSNGDIKTTTHAYGESIQTPYGTFSIILNPEKNNIETQPIFIEFRDIDSMALEYKDKLDVRPVSEEGGGLLQMYLTDAIPQRGVDVINTLIEVYARESANHKNQLAKTTLKIIDERLELLTNDLGDTEKDVEIYKQSNQLTDVSTDAARFMQLADVADAELSLLRAQINALNSLESSLQSSAQTSINSFNVQNQLIITLITQYNEQLQKRQALVRATGAGNPLLGEIDRQLQDLKATILGNVQSIKSVMMNEQSNLASKSASYRTRVSTVPTAERALLEINRDQTLKQSLYLYLLQKREEEALSMSSPFSDTRIIETPKATSYPVSPNTTAIYLGAFLFGLFVPFVGLFAKQNLSTKISTPDDIKELTSTMLLGSIASSKQKETIVVGENNVSPASELFRLMRFNLKFISKGESQQVIMVTSTKQGEGKTFISINLGASLAIAGKKVVILGFDLRAPRLMKDVGLTYTQGITDYIVDHNVDINAIIVPHKDINNLHFIGSGTIPPNPGELMLSNRVSELINNLKKEYDYIIIDTPPIGKVADAFSLRNYVDSTLYIVRSNYTNKSEIKIINDITESKKLESLMIVLNDMKMEKYGEYSYGYGQKTKKGKLN